MNNPAGTSSNRSQWCFLTGAANFTMLCGAALLFSLEMRYYRARMSVEFVEQDLKLGQLGDIAFGWALLSKSLFAFLPVLAISNLFYFRGWRRSGYFTLFLGVTLVLFWLIADVYISHITGQHVTEFLEFLWQPGAWQWAGDESSSLRVFGLVWTVLMFAILIAGGIGRWIGGALFRRLSPTTIRVIAAATILIYAFGLLGYTLGRIAVSSRGKVVLSVLERRLPMSPPLASLFPLTVSPQVEQLDREITPHYRNVHSRLAAPKPVDDSVRVTAEIRPHVVLFVLESLRGELLTREIMPRLAHLSEDGVILRRHYSSSNMSHFGFFSLLYGRLPLNYDAVLDHQVPPQLNHTLRTSGYESTFITSGDCADFRRMGDYLNERVFDRVINYKEGSWIERDRRAIKMVEGVLKSSPDRPQFVVCFLMSTHFPYEFTEEHAKFQPYASGVRFWSAEMGMELEPLRNRYRNSAVFLDAELGAAIQRIDLNQTIVAVTGDHGESLGEDGKLFHGSRLSEIQTRVPMLLIGSGVPAVQIEFPTTHCDYLPTLLSLLNGKETAVRGCHGRNVLAESIGSSPERLMLVHAVDETRFRRFHNRVLYIHGERRLPLLLCRDVPGVDVMQFVNEQDQILTDQSVPAAELDEIVQGLSDELERLAGD